MGAGASSALSQRLPLDRAMKIGLRYGFTEQMFQELQNDDTISVKQLIDAVKKHADLQRFDVNHDGKIDGSEMKELQKVLTSNINETLATGTGAEPRKNFKTALAGTVRQEDYLKYYYPLTELGTGMSGTVFSVRSLQSDNHYACKSVRKRGLKDEDLQKLRDEVSLLSLLDHPNIVKIVEAFEDKTHITIIMELCSGGELYDSLITSEFYTENVARQIFRQVVHAINYCHNQGVCHRDLKLENFVFDKKHAIETGNETLKLIDFGLSKRYNTLNRMSTVVGTPYYIAPEIIRAERYGLECDIWSLGVILFMLLTGIPPIAGDSDQELLNNVGAGNLSLVNQWTPDWTQMSEVFDLIKKMLQVDPAKRITAKGIMEHPWLAESASSSATIDLKIVDGMRKFSKMDPLQRIAAKIVAITLNTTEIEQLRAAFLSIDVDKSGIITMEEFTKAMRGSMAESRDIEVLFSKIDMDGTGTLSYTEFISACLTQTSALTKDRLLEAFNRLDPDKSGFIEQGELVELLKGVVTETEAMELIKSADLVDSDGRVSKAEFMSTMSILWKTHRVPSGAPESSPDAAEASASAEKPAAPSS